MDEDLRYRLYSEATVDNLPDLASSDAKTLSEKLKARYPENEIQYYVDLADCEMMEGGT